MIRALLLCSVLLSAYCANTVAALRITAPASGSTLLIDSTITIQWQGADGSPVDLWYSTDDRQTWTLIERGISTGEYQWKVPERTAEHIDFRVELFAGASPVPLRVYPAAHSGEIRSASFSRDGKHIVSAGRDGRIQVRTIATDQVQAITLPNAGEIFTAKFASTADSVFVNQADSIVLWDRVHGTVAAVPIAISTSAPNFRTIDIVPERSLLVAGGAILGVWDYRTGAQLSSATTEPSLLYTAAFSHDASRVVYAGDNGAIYEWEWGTQQLPTVYKQHGAGNLNLVVWSAAFAPGDSMIASAGVDATARLWKHGAGDTAVHQWRHSSHVRAVAWASNARRVVSASLDATIQQWEPQSGRAIGAPLNHGAQVLSVDYSPTGDTLLSAGRDGSMILWKSGVSEESRDTASYALGRECVLEVPHIAGSVGKGVYIPLLWRNRADIPEFMTAEGVVSLELPNTLVDVVAGGNTLVHRRGTERDTIEVEVRPGVPGDTIAVAVARVLLGVPVTQDIRILSVRWLPGVRLVPTTVDGSVTVQDTCGLLTLRAVHFADKRAALTIVPNPVVAQQASAIVNIAVDETPYLAIYDARGVEVAVVGAIPARAGIHTVTLPIEHLTTGDYFVRLRTADQQYSTKFTIVR